MTGGFNLQIAWSTQLVGWRKQRQEKRGKTKKIKKNMQYRLIGDIAIWGLKGEYLDEPFNIAVDGPGCGESTIKLSGKRNLELYMWTGGNVIHAMALYFSEKGLKAKADRDRKSCPEVTLGDHYQEGVQQVHF